MTFSSAISYLKDGRAAKVPSMAGYVYRTDDTGELPEGVASRYTIGFMERSDTDGDGKTLHPFVFSVSDAGVTTVTDPSTKMTFDGQLLQALLSDEWTVGSAEDYEKARTGSDRRW